MNREPKPHREELVGQGEWTHQAVPPGCECPQCQEWCMDLLIWIDDQTVECQTCQARYNPVTGEHHEQPKA